VVNTKNHGTLFRLNLKIEVERLTRRIRGFVNLNVITWEG